MVLILAISVICCVLGGVLGEEYCLTKTQKDCPGDTFLVKAKDSCFYTCEPFDYGEDKPGEL